MQGERLLARFPVFSIGLRSDAILVAVVLAACLFCNAVAGVDYLTSFNEGIFDIFGRPVGRDFINYWAAGVAVLQGMVPVVFGIDSFHSYQEILLQHSFAHHNWSYPPHMLLLVWPFGALPYLWALAAWSLLGLGLYLWSATVGRPDRSVLLLALLLAPATFVNLTGGQNGFLTAALLIGGLRLLGARPILAGVLFGILTVKPQLGILLPFALLASRQWTTIVAAGLTAFLLMAGSILCFGWESWVVYINQVIPHQTVIMNERGGNFLTMMPSAYIGLRILEVSPAVRTVVQAIFAMTALGGVIWAFSRPTAPDLRFGVLATGTLLASPYSFNYDMTTVMLAVALAAFQGMRDGFRPGERVTLVATWMLPTTVVWLNASYTPVGSLILLACFVYLLMRVRRSPGLAHTQGAMGGTVRPIQIA